ncbi:MAG: DUF4468 domain-containing protein [Flavobacteriales bacterium]|nr:DUF4468 domain-containing protein [Flavobacteriales bacterium]
MRYFFAFVCVFCSVGLFAQNLDSLFKAHDTEYSFAEKVYVANVTAAQLYKRADRYIRITYSEDNQARIERSENRQRITVYAVMPYEQGFSDAGHKSISGKVTYRLTIAAMNGAFEYKYDLFEHIPQNPKAPKLGHLIAEETCPYEEVKGSEEWKNKAWEDVKSEVFEWTHPQSGALKTVMFTVNPEETMGR